jgi:hypothetical protein
VEAEAVRERFPHSFRIDLRLEVRDDAWFRSVDRASAKARNFDVAGSAA